jgi:pyruvate formate lyase activating enzyme
MINKLIKEGLVDYFAVDIKCPLDEERYYETTGKIGDKSDILKNLKMTILLVQNSGIDYEFRTTFVPGLITKQDIYQIAKQLKGSKKYVIQKFLPNSTLDPEYGKKEMLSQELFDEFKEGLKDYFEEIVIRS